MNLINVKTNFVDKFHNENTIERSIEKEGLSDRTFHWILLADPSSSQVYITYEPSYKKLYKFSRDYRSNEKLISVPVHRKRIFTGTALQMAEFLEHNMSQILKVLIPEETNHSYFNINAYVYYIYDSYSRYPNNGSSVKQFLLFQLVFNVSFKQDLRAINNTPMLEAALKTYRKQFKKVNKLKFLEMAPTDTAFSVSRFYKLEEQKKKAQLYIERKENPKVSLIDYKTSYRDLKKALATAILTVNHETISVPHKMFLEIVKVGIKNNFTGPNVQQAKYQLEQSEKP